MEGSDREKSVQTVQESLTKKKKPQGFIKLDTPVRHPVGSGLSKGNTID